MRNLHRKGALCEGMRQVTDFDAFERFFGKKVPDKIIDNRFWNDNFHPDDVENFKIVHQLKINDISDDFF